MSPAEQPTAPGPLISVVIPTYNRPVQLAECLASLVASMSRFDDFEVIVVDDGSPVAITIDPVLLGRLNCRLIRQPNAGPGAARNTGVAAATGRLLVFTDDDCTLDAGCLAAFAAAHRAAPSCGFGGQTLNRLADNPWSTASQLLNDFIQERFTDPAGSAGFFATNNLAVPAAIFRSIGGFDPGYPLPAGEDRDFCAHWREAGHDLRLLPTALIWHAHPLNLRRFWRQQRNYGRGSYRFRERAAGRNGAPVKLEPIGFYIALCSYPLRRLPLLRALPLVALMLVSQVAIHAGFTHERRLSQGAGRAVGASRDRA